MKTQKSEITAPELVVPAGDPERLNFAVHYGADAVYVGGAGLNLRAYASGFTLEEMEKSVKTAHEAGVKIYVAVNIFAHNRHLTDAAMYLKNLNDMKVDGLIISDPGMLDIAKEKAPGIPIHLSTQAGVTNWRSAAFWHDQGCKRIVLARELTLEEIGLINERVDAELEVFVHGAMCLAYSGRCLVSAYFTGRGANRGECTHPCRWTYKLTENDRPDDPLILEEEGNGSFILSSRDLNMIQHIPELIRTGVKALKIEGRMKGLHYIATLTRIYREAIDKYCADPDLYEVDPFWIEELSKVSHRPYHTGFYFGKPEQVDPEEKVSYYSEYLIAGVVLEYDEVNKTALVEQRNRFKKGDELEVFGKTERPFPLKVSKLLSLEGEELEAAPHPQQQILIKSEKQLHPLDILRLKNIS